MTDVPGIAAAVHRSAALHRTTTPDLCAALRHLIDLAETRGQGSHVDAAQVAAQHLAWLEQSTETTEWAIEWTAVPAGDPERFEPHYNPAIARRLAHTYASHGTEVVACTVRRGPYEKADQ